MIKEKNLENLLIFQIHLVQISTYIFKGMDSVRTEFLRKKNRLFSR